MSTQTLEATVVKKTLANGLTVLIKEDHSSPIVAVNAWFGVGSVHETDEIGGLAHFQEHMVFKGTKRYGVGEIARIVRGAGGNLNAGTSFSYTMYYVVLPSERIQTALEVQADAMMHSTFDPEEFAKERLVVIDEARMYDDRPESFTFYRTMELGFGHHTYRRPIAGYPPVVEKFTREQLVDFYTNYYRPGNAVLVVVGDVDPDDALRRITDVYGKWKAGPVTIQQPPAEPPQAVFRYKGYTGPMDHGYLGAGFHVPNILHKDYPALEMISELLSSGRSSRLYREVLERKRLVTSASASLLAERWPGFFLVMGTMPPEKWAAARDAIFAEIERLKHERVEEDELEKVRRQIERSMYHNLESMEGQASSLGYYQLLGDYRLADHHRNAVRSVTAAQIMEAARKYFHPDNMSLVSYVPAGSAAVPGEADQHDVIASILSRDGGVSDMSDSPDPAGVVVPIDTPEGGVGRASGTAESGVVTFDLNNGVRVLVKRRPNVPLVSVLTSFQGGGRFEPREQSGIAMLTHRSLAKGTQSWTFEEISERVESLGGSIDSYANFDTGGVFLDVLSEHLDDALPVYREVLRAPRFGDERIEKEKQKLLEELTHRRDNPVQFAMDALFKKTFGDHPYSHPFFGDPKEASALTSDQCAAWYKSLLVPANTVITFVGDIDETRARDAAHMLLGDLTPAPVRTPDYPAPVNPVEPGNHLLHRRDIKQAVTFVGFTSAAMMTDDSTALQVLNGVLTGLGGRLFVELRDKRSLGYMTGSSINPMFDRSIFFGYANPGPDGLDEAVRVILAECEKVAESLVTEEELERSREWLIGSRLMQMQSGSSQASSYGTYETLGFGWEVVDNAPERVRAVTREQMRDVARRVFVRENAVIVRLLSE